MRSKVPIGLICITLLSMILGLHIPSVNAGNQEATTIDEPIEVSHWPAIPFLQQHLAAEIIANYAKKWQNTPQKPLTAIPKENIQMALGKWVDWSICTEQQKTALIKSQITKLIALHAEAFGSPPFNAKLPLSKQGHLFLWRIVREILSKSTSYLSQTPAEWAKYQEHRTFWDQALMDWRVSVIPTEMPSFRIGEFHARATDGQGAFDCLEGFETKVPLYCFEGLVPLQAMAVQPSEQGYAQMDARGFARIAEALHQATCRLPAYYFLNITSLGPCTRGLATLIHEARIGLWLTLPPPLQLTIGEVVSSLELALNKHSQETKSLIETLARNYSQETKSFMETLLTEEREEPTKVVAQATNLAKVGMALGGLSTLGFGALMTYLIWDRTKHRSHLA
ncbi:MAG: hypothetical protein LBI20_02935 [Holosporales bacterium]|jgi:hypothetical protein|nr:hypothetical protein [Holosporales bacterium]